MNFAIIGCGSVSIDHAISIKKLGHKIIYGSTKSEDSASWKFFKKKFPSTQFLTIEEILKNKNIDRIVSCLPLNEQVKYCKRLLSSKKPILIEKPLHFNYKNLKKIINNKNIFLKNKVIAYNRRNYEVVSILKNKIKKSKIKSVEVNISENYEILNKKYNHKLKKFFLHVGSSSHIIDLLFFLFGDLKILRRWSYKNKKLNSIFLLLSTRKNFPIFVKINSMDPENASIKIRFYDDTLWSLSPIEQLNVYKGYKIKKSNKNFFRKEYISNLRSNYRESNNLRPGFLSQIKKFANLNFKELCRPKENLKLIKLFNQIV